MRNTNKYINDLQGIEGKAERIERGDLTRRAGSNIGISAIKPGQTHPHPVPQAGTLEASQQLI